jgi:PadR family transcriptional regulator PadR
MSRSLGEFEQAILFALVELDEEAYGAEIGRTIERRTSHPVSAGAIYTALDRLESRGLAESWVGEPTGERGGRRKRHYRITAEGAAGLKRSVMRLKSMSDGLIPKLDAMTGDRG